jgi:hypothetical protein
VTECICGCGRKAGPGQRGLAYVCYMRLYRAGGRALLDARYPARPTGRPRRTPPRLVDLRAALAALEVARG